MSASSETAAVSEPRARHRLRRYGPLVLWAAVIFLFSSGLFSGSHTAAFAGPILRWLFPHASDATINLIHAIVIRKGAHLTAYAILALLAARAFGSSSHRWIRAHWFLTSLLFVMVYSLSDEYHQSFVASRTGSIYDSMIDSFGGLMALTVLAVRRRRASSAQTIDNE